MTGGAGMTDSCDIPVAYATPFWWILQRMRTSAIPEVNLDDLKGFVESELESWRRLAFSFPRREAPNQRAGACSLEQARNPYNVTHVTHSFFIFYFEDAFGQRSSFRRVLYFLKTRPPSPIYSCEGII